jgi:aminopeptidase N/puromycin-sensitive aminopeptidase
MQLGNAASIHPSLAPTYLELAALGGDQALYDKYMDRTRKAGQGRRYPYRDALVYFSDPALQKRTLDYAMSPEVRTQDSPAMIGDLIARPASARQAWDFTKANWEALQKTGVFQGLPQIVGATASFCDEAARDDVRSFFESHPNPALSRQVRQALESIDRCIRTRNQQRPNLAAFLH